MGRAVTSQTQSGKPVLLHAQSTSEQNETANRFLKGTSALEAS